MSTPLVSDADRLRRLQALTDAALSSLDLDELLATMVDRLREVLEVDTCAVLLLDAERQELVATAAVGIEEEVEQGVRIPLGKGFAGRVAAERRPVILDDVDHADVLNPILREKGIKSLLGVPLLVQDEVIGVLHVGSLIPRSFREEETDLLGLAAERAAIAIDHARLFTLERAARRRVEHMQAITDVTLADLQVHPLLTVLLPRIRGILGADTCAVLLLDAERQELVATAAVGIEEEVEQGVRIPLGKGFAGRVAAERRPVILDDVDHADVLNPILREKGIKSLLGVPLLVQDEVIGVLHVGSLVPRVFIRPDVELLTLVAGRVALAVERSRLLEETLALDELRLNFVAIASHELRTPATAVYGTLATLAQLKDLEAETRDELIRVGYEQAERLRRLTDQLLDLSRLDARNVALKPEKLAVREALAGILRDTVPADTTVELRVDPALTARIDPMVLDRVVSNLLINAIRHGSPPMLVSAERNDQGLLISVEDSGAGIQEELQPHVFERFTRAPDAVGPGLGLTIARTYAKAHGGDLVLAPTSSGARFELTVPQD